MVGIIKRYAQLVTALALVAPPAFVRAQTGDAGARPVNAAPVAAPETQTQQHPQRPAIPPLTLRADAPELYTVQRGDTLWGIARRYLDDPWQWPALWGMNREAIANPHLIYPGQKLLLDRRRQRLRVAQPLLYEKRFPTLRHAPLEAAIPTLPLAAVNPFLTRPLVVTQRELANAGRVIGFEEGRTLAGLFDRAFAVGVPEEARRVQLFRPAEPITRRDGKTLLGFEARYLGEAEVAFGDDPRQGAVLTLTKTVAEIRAGDRVLVPEPEPLTNFVPHAPDPDLDAEVVRFWRQTPESGAYEVVLLDAGENEGLERGHVVALWRDRGAITDPETKQAVPLPPKRYGVAMVFRTFPHLAYALVLETTDSVRLGDRARAP
ncbi:hypothetical protein Hthe01_08830 [Hydrogenophilus thermoluteolus]|uniref:LysM peptidoglycan-binding domain-containing protein n=1 Tax=Hydrogenophilus thermoluteolus TaxID=297 RepID=UPI0024A0CA85|nr:LysM peptidoglycan-binding domain-containing protein [Hydrogenophilus thermoluteolus]GLW60534.1 hypothetical protein Hthe01_08830 [Hydrogenophilus thermoluteolus]